LLVRGTPQDVQGFEGKTIRSIRNVLAKKIRKTKKKTMNIGGIWKENSAKNIWTGDRTGIMENSTK
jgi:hypothetical protein